MSAPALTAPAPQPAVRHVAIIMDGNGRWAQARGLSRSDGHRAGVEAARRAVQAAQDHGLEFLTLYSFSTENWRRPAAEVRDLMGLLKEFIIIDLPKLKRENVRIRIIGDRKSLDAELKALVRRAEEETKRATGPVLQIAFNYGGRDEMVRAARAAAKAVAMGRLRAEDIDEAALAQFLDTGDAPDPDLVIRTSGEKRVSNFLIWQAAYAEYVFTDVLWPDFNEDCFAAALAEFRARERRYGGVEATPDPEARLGAARR